eukprot:6458611-Amphidinium_carterae.1
MEMDTNGAFKKLTDVEVFAELSLPDFPLILHQLRLREFRRLVVADNDLIRAAFAFSTGEGSVVRAYIDSIQWLQNKTHLFDHVPRCTVSTLGVWIQTAITQWGSWTQAIKQAVRHGVDDLQVQARGIAESRAAAENVLVASDLGQPSGGMTDSRVLGRAGEAVDLTLEEDAVEADTAFACVHCGKTFNSKRGRDAHARNAHGDLPLHTFLVRARTCPACDAQFSTRAQAVNHLRTRRACKDFAVQNVVPLTLAEYQHEMAMERKTPKQRLRARAPVTGPQYTDATGKPCARFVEAVNPDSVFGANSDCEEENVGAWTSSTLLASPYDE